MGRVSVAGFRPGAWRRRRQGGAGKIDWPRPLSAPHAAGVRDFLVEQEPTFAHSRLDSVGISFGYLSKPRA